MASSNKYFIKWMDARQKLLRRMLHRPRFQRWAVHKVDKAQGRPQASDEIEVEFSPVISIDASPRTWTAQVKTGPRAMESSLWLFLLSASKTGWAWEQNNSLGLGAGGFRCLETFFTRENKDPERLVSLSLGCVFSSSRSGVVSSPRTQVWIFQDIKWNCWERHSLILRTHFSYVVWLAFLKRIDHPCPLFGNIKWLGTGTNSPTSSIVLHIFCASIDCCSYCWKQDCSLGNTHPEREPSGDSGDSVVWTLWFKKEKKEERQKH